VLYLDGSGRAAVLTARSVVDGAYTESDAFGASPQIAAEQIKVIVASGPVLRGHRVWVAPDGRDLAILVLDEAPPDLPITPAAMFAFDVEALTSVSTRSVRADGAAIAPVLHELPDRMPTLADHRGAALLRGDQVTALFGQRALGEAEPAVVRLDVVPADLRPRP
jgi:hypothetical protein